MNMLSKATVIPALWLLSFLGSFLILPISDAVQTAAVVTMIVSLLGFVVCSEQVTFKYTKLTILIGLLWGLAAVSVMLSEVPFVSLTYFFFFSAFPLTFLLFSFGIAKDIWMPVRFIILALGIGAIIQFYCMPEMLKANGTHWPLADNNSLAVILASGALLFIAESFKSAKWAYHNIAAAAVLFAGVMTTGGVAVFFAFFLVLSVFTWAAKPLSLKPIAWFIGTAVLLMLVMTTSDMSVYHFFGHWTSTVDVFMNKGLVEPNEVSGSRLIIWKSGIDIFKQHAMTGTGIGTFFLYYPQVRSIFDDSAGYMAHNDFIQIAAEMGIVAPVLALAIIGFLIYATIKYLKGMTGLEERVNLLLPFSVFGLIIGHSLVNFNLYVLPTLMLMGMLLANWNAQIKHAEIQIGVTKTLREGISFLMVMAILVPMWGCYLSEYYTNRATDDLVKGNIQGFSDHLNLADKWSVGQNGRAVLQAARFAAATEHNDRALTLLDRAEHLNPRMAQIYAERARIWSLTDLEKGLAEAQRALQMDVGSLPVRMTMAEILNKMNKPKEAYHILKEGVQMAPSTRNPILFYQFMAVQSLEQGDLELNAEMLKRIRQIKYFETLK